MACLSLCGPISARYADILPDDYACLGNEFEAAAIVNPLSFEGFAVNIDIVTHQNPPEEREMVAVELIDKALRRGAIDQEMADQLLSFFELEAARA